MLVKQIKGLIIHYFRKSRDAKTRKNTATRPAFPTPQIAPPSRPRTKPPTSPKRSP